MSTSTAPALNINPMRPLEELVGSNCGIVRMRLGNFHAGHSLLRAARHARPRQMRQHPVALRRGWVKCVIETWQANRELWLAVS